MAYFEKDEYDKVRGMSVWSRELLKQLRKAAELNETERKHIISENVWKPQLRVPSGWRTRQNSGNHSYPSLLIVQAHPKDDFILRVTENHWEKQKGSKEKISGWRVRRLCRAVRLEQL